MKKPCMGSESESERAQIYLYISESAVMIIIIQIRLQNRSYPVVRRVDESIVVTRTILAGGENRWQIETPHLLCWSVHMAL